jgi:hypothetical protein
MAVATVDAYGAPSYGPIGGVEGIVGHTPENVDHTLAQAIAIARWQAGTGNTSGGSYHGILGWDAGRGPMSDSKAWVMVRSVPWNQAAGGLSSKRTADVWGPGRYPWLAQLLSDAAYADPNRFLQQISLSGKAAWWKSKMGTTAGRAEVRGAIVALAEWTIVLETAYHYDAVLSSHLHWQVNRSDPGPLDLWDHVLVEYAKLKTAPTPAPDLQQQIDALKAQLAAAATLKTALEGRIGRKNTAIAEAVTLLGSVTAKLNAAKAI